MRSLQSLLQRPGVFCAPHRSSKLQELTTGLILTAGEERIAPLLGLAYEFILHSWSVSTVLHFPLHTGFFQRRCHGRRIPCSEGNCVVAEELCALVRP